MATAQKVEQTGLFVAGEPWPPAGNRVASYERGMAIFDGLHKDALPQSAEMGRYGLYITCNLASLIVKAGTDLLFGEELKLEFEADASPEKVKALQAYWTDNHLQRKFYEGALDCGAVGDCVYQVWRDGDDNVAVDPCLITTWFPKAHPDDVRDIERHRFGWKRSAIDTRGQKVDFIKMRIHERGTITNELWLLQKGKLVKQFLPGTDEWASVMDDAVETEITQVPDDFLIVHVPNYRTSREYHGRSEFLGLETMFSSVNARLTQWDHVLKEHSVPVIKGPKGVLKEDGTFDRRALDYVEVEDKEKDTLAYLTYDAKLEDSRHLIEMLTEKILLISETDPALLGINSGSGPISGRALKFSIMRTLAKVSRKRLYWDSAIKKLLELVQRVQGEAEPLKPTIVWPDGLPQDRQELQEELSQRLVDRTVDRVTAIQRMDDVDKDMAEQLVEVIDEDDTSETKAVQDQIDGRPRPTFSFDTGEIEEEV